MLGLLLIYFFARPFYRLAERYDRSGIGYAILAIVTYYAGLFLFGFIFALFAEAFFSSDIEEINEYVLTLIALPFALSGVYLLYLFLEKRFKAASNGKFSGMEDLLDGDLIERK